MIFYIVTAPALKNMNQPPLRIITHSSFQQTLARCELKLALKLSSVRFYVFLKEDPSTIIGTVCLHNIIKMPYFTSEVGINSMRLISIMDMPEKLCLWHCLSAFMVSGFTKSCPLHA